MIRRLSIPLVLLALVLSGCQRSTAPRRIFLVTIDTLRADHLSLYGYPRTTSPFIDSLGESGLVFETAFASCARTAPSHASLFTALHPAQHRLLKNGAKLSGSLSTLAQLIRQQGYRTAGFTSVKFLRVLGAGFDEFHSTEEIQPATVIFDQANSWIRAQKRRHKLFVWIHLYDVHQWRNNHHVDHKALRRLKALNELRGQPLLDYLARHHGAQLGRKPEKLLRTVNLYDGQILSVDQAFGDFFRRLESADLASGALWVVTSDHGEGLGTHDYLDHGKTVYEEQIRVPLVLHFADQRFAPRRIEGLVQLVDVAATLAQLAGTSFDAQVIPPMGRSLLPVLQEPDQAWNAKAVYAQRRPVDERRLRRGWTPGDVFALRTQRHKVIGNTEGQHEIYDLEDDPFELNNLIADPSPEQERLLDALLRRYSAMVKQGEHLGSGDIDPRYAEELRALGYL